MRKLFLGICAVAVVALGFVETKAQCKCVVGPGSKHYTPSKALETSDVVFTGEITDVRKGSSADEEKVTFKIKGVWKKEVGETFTLTASRNSCGFFGEVGEKFLNYAYKRKEIFTISGCTRTRLLEKSGKDLKEFEEKGEKPIKI